MRIKTKISLTLLIFSLIPIVFIGLVSINYTRTIVHQQISEKLVVLLDSKVAVIEEKINVFKQELSGIATRTKFRALLNDFKETDELDRAGIEKILSDALKKMDGLSGAVLLDYNFSPISVYGAADLILLEDSLALVNKTSSFRIAYDTKIDKLINSSPIISDDEEVIGHIILVKDPEVLTSSLSLNSGIGNTGEFILGVRNSFGDAVFIHEPRFPAETIFHDSISKNAIDIPIVHALRGNSGIFRESIDYRGVEVVSATAYMEEIDLGLVAKIDKSEVTEPVKNFFSTIMIAITIVLLIIIILTNFVARSVSLPLINLTDFIKKITRDNNLKIKLDRRHLSSVSEVGVLAQSFNHLLGQLNSLYDVLEKKVKDRTKELEDAKALDEAILKNIGYGLVFLDPQRNVLLVNDSATKILGFSREDLIGRDWFKVVTVNDGKGYNLNASKRPVSRLLKSKVKDTITTTTTDSYFFNRKDKKTSVPVAITTSKVFIRDELIGVIVVFADISKDKEVDRVKTEFVSLASHQLRTPLTSIGWFVEMLLDESNGKLTRNQKDFLQEVYTGKQRMAELISALLNVSRLELGTYAVDVEEVDSLVVLDEVIAELKPVIKDKKLVLKVDLDKNLKLVESDHKLIAMIFQNFLTNAIKYTQQKGSIHVTLKEVKKGEKINNKKIKYDSLYFSVEDTGIGIPAKQQDKIFSKLFRAENVRAIDTDGTGLGLYIIKSVIEVLGGQVWFTSEEHKGSVFSCLIPQKYVGDQKQDGKDKKVSLE